MITIALALLLLLLSTGLALADPFSATVATTAAVASTASVATGTAAAATAVTAGVAATGITAAGVTTFLVNLGLSAGISLGLSLLSKALAGKPKAGETLSGLESNVQIGGDIPRQLAIGLCGSKGQLVYHNSPPDQQHTYYQQVYVLSDWLCDGITSLFINGKAVTLTPSPAGGGLTYYVAGEYAGLISVAFYDGSQIAADSALIALAQPAGKWTTNSKLTGMTYAFVSFTYQKGAPLYEGGIPKLTFGLRGARLYDWRKDSSAGGSGTQRWDNPTTWTYSENPAVAIYNYMRGFYRNGELIIGMGVPPADILIDTFTAAANICDEPVILDVGGTEARYRICSFLSADQTVTHSQTLEVLLSTMAGYLYDYGGQYYLQAGAAYSTVATITDNDLVTGAPATFTAKRSRSELINRIHGQFINTADEFQPGSYTPQISASGVAADMEELGRQLDLASVPSQYQAERIAQIRLREVRRQGSANITLGFEHLNKQVGDWITWNSSRYGNRVWRIVNKMIDPVSLTVTLELNETNTNVYSWTTADEGDPVHVGVPIQASALITQPAGFGIQAVALIDGSGNQQPGLKFSWSPITDPTVDAVVIEWRQVGTTAASRHSDPSVSDGVYQTTDGVIGGLNYEARATITTTPPRITTWTAWIAVATLTSDTVFNISAAVDPAAPIPTGLALTSAIETLATGEVQTRLTADWNDVAGVGLTYEIDIKEGTGAFVTFPTAHSNYQWRGLRSGTVVTARVRSITALGTPSGYSAEVTHTVATDSIPPGAITGLNGSASFQTMFLYWTNPPDKDFAYTEFSSATVNNLASRDYLVTVFGSPGVQCTHTVTGVPPGTTRYFWVRPFDTSGNAGPSTPLSATGGFQLTSQSIITADIAANAIDQTKFANNMQPVGIIASTGAAHLPNIDSALNTADGKLYRWNGSAWIASVPATDVTGQMTNAQIAAVDAAKLTGQITSTQITDDAITSPKIAAGAVSTSELAAGAVTAGAIAANAVTAGAIQAGAVTAGKIAANAVTANEIAADTITAAQIAAGAINVSELAAKAVTTEKLAVGSRNVAYNAEFTIGPSAGAVIANYSSGWGFGNATGVAPAHAQVDYTGIWTPWSPSGFRSIMFHFSGVPTGFAYWLNSGTVLFDGTVQRYQVSEGQTYEVSAALSCHRCTAFIILRYYNSAGTVISGAGGNIINVANATVSVLEFPRSAVMLTAPAGAVSADFYIVADFTNYPANDPYCFISAVYFGGTSAENLTKNPGGLPAFAPYQTPGITIIEKGQIRTGEVITEHMVANTIQGDRIQTDTLDANKVKANTVMAGTVIVSGQTLSNTTAYAYDPISRGNTVGGTINGNTVAASGAGVATEALVTMLDRTQRPVDYINAPGAKPRDSTLIGPGVIQIAGGTTLASWRDGGDNTLIAGGQVAANTIAANKVKIGVRGIEVRGLDFQARPPAATSNIVDWSVGNVTYLGDDGNPVSINISANAVAWAAGYCLFWTKGTSFLQLSSSVAGVTGGDNVIIAVYNGGGAINVLYGGTIIDGTRITTGSVHADRIVANTITAAQVLQSAELITNSATIKDLTVTTLKIATGNISAVYAAFDPALPNGANIFPAAIGALAFSRYLVTFVINDVAASRQATDVRGLRQCSVYAQRGGVNTLVGTSWTYDAIINIVAVNNHQSQFPALVGQFVYTVPADDSYLFFVANQTGLAVSATIAVTELKR